MPTVLFRADASTTVGSGHVMRCLALAQAWIDRGGTAAWLARSLPPAVHTRLTNERIDVSVVSEMTDADDPLRTVAMATAVNADWVVLDGYGFGDPHLRALEVAGIRTALIDDCGSEGGADLLLNQNGHAAPRMYPLQSSRGLMLLGTRFVLLRRDLRRTRNERNVPPRHVLVLTGGGGNPALVQMAVDALKPLREKYEFDVRLVRGDNARAGAADLTSAHEWLTTLDVVEDMGRELAWADIAISAGGSTTYELMHAGVPAVLVSVAPNQVPVTAAAAQLGAAIDLGHIESITADAMSRAIDHCAGEADVLQRMSSAGRAAVDGRGAARVSALMIAGLMRLRRATDRDARIVWTWANDPDTRAVSFSHEPIAWETHERWYSAALENPQMRLFVGEDHAGTPVGIVRFEIDGAEAVLSINVAPAARGKGYGAWLIQRGADAMLCEQGVTRVLGYVKSSNVASLRAFERAGFMSEGPREANGVPAVLFSMSASHVASFVH